jgi:predicted transcriptional regulator of viral defense system
MDGSSIVTAAEKRQQLFNLANTQYGLFTAKQAESVGFERANFSAHVASGEWVQESRGLYRLVNYPDTTEQEYMKWYLWTRNKDDVPQGAYSHETALVLYDLTDLLPSKFHITVPKDFRRTAAKPEILELHFKNLRPAEISSYKGFLVTIPVVTIEQVASDPSISHDVVENALSMALKRGVVTMDTIQARRNKSPNNIWDRLLKDSARG